MKAILRTVLYALLSLLSISSVAQIKINGTLLLGDTTQQHILNTKNGDKFIGRLSGWTKDSVHFKMKTGNVLHYSSSELNDITVKRRVSQRQIPQGEKDLSKGVFSIVTSDEKDREGVLVLYNKHGARLKYNRRRRSFVRAENLYELSFDDYKEGFVYSNYYKMKLKNQDKAFGHLVYMNQDYVLFQPERGNMFQVDRADIYSLVQKKGYREINGHQRALLTTPTGFNLKKGQSEFRNIDYFVNSFSRGISDNLSGTVGLISVEPYFQLRASYDFGPLLHVSSSLSLALQGAVGFQAAASLGTPDYFLNLGFMKNKGRVVAEETDMDAVFAGGSWRIGRRNRLIAEAIHLIERGTIFDANGYGTNTFSLAYGWFGKRVSMNLGLMMAERIQNDFCFGPLGVFPCFEEIYDFQVIPVISTSVYFGEIYKKGE